MRFIIEVIEDKNMNIGIAWQEFLAIENNDPAYLIGKLELARETQHKRLKSPLLGFLPDVARGLQNKKRSHVKTAVTFIGYIEDPSSVIFPFQGVMKRIAQNIPFTNRQSHALKEWVNEGKDGPLFLGTFLLYLVEKEQHPTQELIELFATFRSKMRDAR